MMEHSATTVLPPSELGNPQRTRVSTFPQRRRLRLSNWGKVPNPRQSHISTDSRAEPKKQGLLPFKRSDRTRRQSVVEGLSLGTDGEGGGAAARVQGEEN